MSRSRSLFSGPWRALPVLGVTQVLAWGCLYYPPVLIVPLIAAERGWSGSFAMSGYSAALLTGGLVAPMVGRTIDRRGGQVMMTAGALMGAAGLAALTVASHPITYITAWMLVGAAMSASLYESAFATLGRIFGLAARRPITILTFVGGLSSTVGWPATQYLVNTIGWRGCYLVYAALLAAISAPLLAFVLPRERADLSAPARKTPLPQGLTLPPRGWPFLLVTAGFSAYAFIPSGLSAHLIAIFQRGGLDPATAVAVGMLFGPSQVLARACEFAFGAKAHPLTMARFAFALITSNFIVLLMAGITTPLAAFFYILFGASNGLITIARGTVPLSLFGAAGFGVVVGRMAAPWLVMQAASPLVLALVIERFSDLGALMLAGLFAAVALACFFAIRQPRPTSE
ncbi:MAG: MFS transporter [Xanthobacteraceae bacterium]